MVLQIAAGLVLAYFALLILTQQWFWSLVIYLTMAVAVILFIGTIVGALS